MKNSALGWDPPRPKSLIDSTRSFPRDKALGAGWAKTYHAVAHHPRPYRDGKTYSFLSFRPDPGRPILRNLQNRIRICKVTLFQGKKQLRLGPSCRSPPGPDRNRLLMRSAARLASAIVRTDGPAAPEKR